MHRKEDQATYIGLVAAGGCFSAPPQVCLLSLLRGFESRLPPEAQRPLLNFFPKVSASSKSRNATFVLGRPPPGVFVSKHAAPSDAAPTKPTEEAGGPTGSGLRSGGERVSSESLQKSGLQIWRQAAEGKGVGCPQGHLVLDQLGLSLSPAGPISWAPGWAEGDPCSATGILHEDLGDDTRKVPLSRLLGKPDSVPLSSKKPRSFASPRESQAACLGKTQRTDGQTDCLPPTHRLHCKGPTFWFSAFLPGLLPRGITHSGASQRMLEILGQDLALLLSGSEAGPPLLPLGSSPPPLRGHPSPRPPTLPPEHRWLHFLRDLAKMQRRLRGRPKKAPPLGCFGIKLDRIGTFSGLGC
ncbi:uncharacterized protein PHA67_016772 [Liasis olivaceus]